MEHNNNNNTMFSSVHYGPQRSKHLTQLPNTTTTSITTNTNTSHRNDVQFCEYIETEMNTDWKSEIV